MKHRRIGLQHGLTKPPILEWNGNVWRVWTAYNSTLSLGTFIELDELGNAVITTIKPDGTESLQRM